MCISTDFEWTFISISTHIKSQKKKQNKTE